MVESKGKHRMVGIARRICSSMILLVVVSIPGQGTCADMQGGRLVPWRIERDIQRFKTVATDNVMKLLAIMPGMTILDIGAGTGQFAYEFAKILNGTGNVYATDTNKYCIDHIKKEAAGRGLGNLHPVLVKKDGMDMFYGKNKYDLITVFHVSIPYEDQVDYFRELRGFMAEGGRLILILYKIPTPFSPDDFTGNFGGFLGELSLDPAGSPYYKLLKDSTRKRIRNHPEVEPPEELKSAIVEDFNEMLSDTHFAAQFFDGSVFRKETDFSPEERRYADWFLLPYTDSGARNKDIGTQRASGFREFSTINKLLILQRYRKYLKKDGLFLSGFTPSIRAVFEKAGYRLEREAADLIPFEDMIVFSSP
jgi:ubiquinone/menaquinone biosynthesis C-methylase UbiE